MEGVAGGKEVPMDGVFFQFPFFFFFFSFHKPLFVTCYLGGGEDRKK